jgi:hypothetical protein
MSAQVTINWLEDRKRVANLTRLAAKRKPAKQGTRFDTTGTYVCVMCGKRTRNTNTGEAGTGLCKKCYQQCEQENLESDEG